MPAFVSAVFGEALTYELFLLVIFVLVLRIRTSLYRVLRWYRGQHRSDNALRAALWKVLRGQ